jgi:hypothetical protein
MSEQLPPLELLEAVEANNYEVLQQTIIEARAEKKFRYMRDFPVTKYVGHLLHWARMKHAKNCKRCKRKEACPIDERFYQVARRWIRASYLIGDGEQEPSFFDFFDYPDAIQPCDDHPF